MREQYAAARHCDPELRECEQYPAGRGHYRWIMLRGGKRRQLANFILPFIEQQALFDKYDFDEANESPIDNDGDGLMNSVVRETDLQAFDCPSDEETELNDRPGSGRNILYNRGSYRGNAGLSTVESGAFWDSSSQQYEQYAHQRGPLPGIGVIYASGRFGNRSRPTGRWSIKEPTELSQITDGTSNTVLLGEKSHLAVSEEGRRRRTFWAYSYTSYNLSLTFLQTRSIINDYDRCLAIPGDFGADPCKRSWGSLHTGGFNTVLCDGSVQFLSDSIDVFVFGDMSTIAGGELVSQF